MKKAKIAVDLALSPPHMLYRPARVTVPRSFTEAVILFPCKDPVSQAVMLFADVNLYDWTYRSRLNTSQSVLTRGGRRGKTDTWGGSKSTLIKYHSILPPGCLSFIRLGFIKEIIKEELVEISGLSLASPLGLQMRRSISFAVLCQAGLMHWLLLVISNPNDF